MSEPDLAFGIGAIVNGSDFEHSGGSFYINEKDVVVWVSNILVNKDGCWVRNADSLILFQSE